MRKKGKTDLSRRERKKGETRSKIIAVAMELFRNQGFEESSVDQIAEEADVAKGTLYNYFPSKEAILHGYMQNSARENEHLISALIQGLPDTRSRLTALFQHVSEWMKSNRDLFKIYISYRMQNLIQPVYDKSQRSGFADHLQAIIEAGQKTGEIRKDLPSALLSLHLEMMHFGVVIVWLSGVEKISLKTAFVQVIDLFLEGAKKGKPKG